MESELKENNFKESEIDSKKYVSKSFIESLKQKCIVNLKNENLNELKDLFSHPTWLRISKLRNFSQQTPGWRNLRDDYITASDASKFLCQNPFETKDEAIDKKARGCVQNSNIGTLHGNKHENIAAKLLCNEIDDIGFSVGLIAHPIVSFLAMSPDIILLRNQTIGEIKCPYFRKILKEEQEKELEPLIKELMNDGNAFKYRTITNLPVEYSGILEEQYYNYHQMQMQMEILQFDTDFGFYCQLGINPAPNYKNDDPLFTITKVKRDFDWLNTNLNQLEKSWNEIQAERKRFPTGFRNTMPKRKCPF